MFDLGTRNVQLSTSVIEAYRMLLLMFCIKLFVLHNFEVGGQYIDKEGGQYIDMLNFTHLC